MAHVDVLACVLMGRSSIVGPASVALYILAEQHIVASAFRALNFSVLAILSEVGVEKVSLRSVGATQAIRAFNDKLVHHLGLY